jgi:hypothetical protein
VLDRHRSGSRSERLRAIRWRPVIAIAATTLLVVAARASAADDWRLVTSDRGVDVYRRTVAGTGLVAFKGVGTIDAPVWKIASILLDTKRAPEWADSLKESRVVRRLGPSGYIEYNRLGMPFIVRDREFVSDVTIEVSPAARTFALVYRPTMERVPASSHVVRGEILAGRFEAVSIDAGRRTRLTAELQADPKGLLPMWLVNMFQRSWPVTTFEHLRAQANKADIVMPAEFADVLAPTRGF